jgi:predicted unusual protein kinase regulating ubiquinone biosynthesis (AarF/ABC1/UbiB family)
VNIRNDPAPAEQLSLFYDFLNYTITLETAPKSIIMVDNLKGKWQLPVSNNQQRTPEEIQQDLQRQLNQMLAPDGAKPDRSKIDLKRYRQVRRFFARAFLHVIWWDIVLNRPVLRWFRTEPLPRWQKIARRYRHLAVEMGGVLIKLGQFLSIRVDVLPTEVTSELAGLRDEVPEDRLEHIVAQVEEDFGRPITDIFEWFSPQSLGAASLAQAHLARLASGEEVVVKVLRPGIDVLVETDLAAIALAIRWLKFYKRVSKRVDLDWLAEEFATITRNELDFGAEGRNAERIAEDFAGDVQVHIPKIYWEYSAARTLTLENVGYIKIDNLAGIEAAGISRIDVAKKFYDVYLQQIFVTNFVHVDPHPGNVFVKPLPLPEEIEAGITAFHPNDPIPYKPGRPFQIAFVDFGMVAIIPERLRAALKDYAIGIGTRDAHRVVQSYADAGVLLPGADLKRIEEATADMLQRLWGVRMGQVKDLAASEMQYFLHEYRDIVYEAPFQFPADMLFIMRAIGILSGMATNLDPNFDPWTETIPFAERLAAEQFQQDWRGWLQEFIALGQLVLRLPNQVDQVLTQTYRGNLIVQASLAPDARKAIRRLEQAISRLVWIVVAVGLLFTGNDLYVEGQEEIPGGTLIILALLAFLWGMSRR